MANEFGRTGIRKRNVKCGLRAVNESNPDIPADIAAVEAFTGSFDFIGDGKKGSMVLKGPIDGDTELLSGDKSPGNHNYSVEWISQNYTKTNVDNLYTTFSRQYCDILILEVTSDGSFKGWYIPNRIAKIEEEVKSQEASDIKISAAAEVEEPAEFRTILNVLPA